MPIGITEFEEGPDETLSFSEGTQPHTILTFLYEHDEQAFTTGEIAEETEIPQDSARTVLHRLLERGLVRHRGRYWAIGTDERLASQAAQEGASSASTTDDYYG